MSNFLEDIWDGVKETASSFWDGFSGAGTKVFEKAQGTAGLLGGYVNKAEDQYLGNSLDKVSGGLFSETVDRSTFQKGGFIDLAKDGHISTGNLDVKGDTLYSVRSGAVAGAAYTGNPYLIGASAGFAQKTQGKGLNNIGDALVETAVDAGSKYANDTIGDYSDDLLNDLRSYLPDFDLDSYMGDYNKLYNDITSLFKSPSSSYVSSRPTVSGTTASGFGYDAGLVENKNMLLWVIGGIILFIFIKRRFS